jgi:hypothetical protein
VTERRDESQYRHKHVWKRRMRTAPSAPISDMEITLTALWNSVGIKERPTPTDLKDPLLWAAWQFGSGMIFRVSTNRSGRSDMMYLSDRKEALKEYRRRVKDFPRSKEIDYGFPVDEAAC